MYGAGSDTTADMISTAIMTFTKYPDLVSRAQAELDNVVGRDRLPDFADESDLVYCSALVREIMRWRTVIAGGLAHASIKDDFYEGESRLICNIGWALMAFGRLSHPRGNDPHPQSLVHPPRPQAVPEPRNMQP